MKAQQEKAIVDYFNKKENQKALDPKGRYDTLTFQSATVEEKKGILYYRFDLRLDDRDAVFTYQPSVMKMVDHRNHLHLEFIRELETYFLEWTAQGE